MRKSAPAISSPTKVRNPPSPSQSSSQAVVSHSPTSAPPSRSQKSSAEEDRKQNSLSFENEEGNVGKMNGPEDYVKNEASHHVNGETEVNSFVKNRSQSTNSEALNTFLSNFS